MKKSTGGIIAGFCAIAAATGFEIIRYLNGREYPKYSLILRILKLGILP